MRPGRAAGNSSRWFPCALVKTSGIRPFAVIGGDLETAFGFVVAGPQPTKFLPPQVMSVGNYVGVTLSRRHNLPLVLEYNGSEVWVQKNWGRALSKEGLAQAAEDVCLRHAHLVVTVSEVLRDELIERGVEPQRIVCYPNCIDPRVYDPARYTAADAVELRRQHGSAAREKVVREFSQQTIWLSVYQEYIRCLLKKKLASPLSEPVPGISQNDQLESPLDGQHRATDQAAPVCAQKYN